LPGQFRNQVAEHMAGGRKAMEQKHCRCLLVASLAIKDFAAINERRSVRNGCCFHYEIPGWVCNVL